ncbi:hypothetical protein LR48_Vigan09g053800 [Vigna angularis]|uniref:Uncharacterized protein n=1 Tax=Phaseolus angularis TaxID=3914 RepID=A0A0L9VB50_PHAAN|nr:hypothetical protein LR48_Vigan09g053800 [Vigna angularis]
MSTTSFPFSRASEFGSLNLRCSPPLSPRNRDAQSLLPLTVKQIYDALRTNDDKANFIVDGVDVNNVRSP